MNKELINDQNNKLLSNNSLKTVIDFLKNASESFDLSDKDSKTSKINISNVNLLKFYYFIFLKYRELNLNIFLKTFLNTADTIISKTENWKDMTKEEKSKSITKLIDLIDTVLFEDDNTDDDIDAPNLDPSLESNVISITNENIGK